MFRAPGHNIAGQHRPQTGHVGQKLLAGGVQLHAHGVDAAGHHVVQAAFELGLIDVVLILAHADGLGIDFDQFGQRVGQTAADGHRAPVGEVQIGKFGPRRLGGGIHRSPAFADHNHRHRGGSAGQFP